MTTLAAQSLQTGAPVLDAPTLTASSVTIGFAADAGGAQAWIFANMNDAIAVSADPGLVGLATPGAGAPQAIIAMPPLVLDGLGLSIDTPTLLADVTVMMETLQASIAAAQWLVSDLRRHAGLPPD